MGIYVCMQVCKYTLVYVCLRLENGIGGVAVDAGGVDAGDLRGLAVVLMMQVVLVLVVCCWWCWCPRTRRNCRVFHSRMS